MIPLTPSFLIAAATSFVGLGEQGGDNRGQMVELFLREVKQPPGQPWCAAFVHHVGYWSHYDHRVGKSSWPLPATASCWELANFAKDLEIDMKEGEPGDVFLKFDATLGRFAHTGIVVSVEKRVELALDDAAFLCITIEGNTNDDGSREGRLTLRKTRRLSTRAGDRFIRWASLDRRLRAA